MLVFCTSTKVSSITIKKDRVLTHCFLWCPVSSGITGMRRSGLMGVLMERSVLITEMAVYATLPT